MKKVMNFLFLSCRKSTELVEKKSAIGLSPFEQVRLKMHTSMCTACTTYQQQSLDLDKSIKISIADQWSEQETPHSNEELKNRIKGKLKGMQSESGGD